MNDYGTFDDTRLPPQLQTRVDAELDKDERTLWVGQPRPDRFRAQAMTLFFVGVFFFGFAIFWIIMAAGMSGMFAGNGQFPGMGIFACFPLFGVPFVLIGLFLLGSPIWLRQKALNTCYAVTDRRAIVWDAGWWNSVSVRSFRPADLTNLRRNEYPDGSGDLIFQELLTWQQGSMNDSFNQGYVYNRQGYWQRSYLGFMGINRVRDVEEIIRRVLLANEKTGGEK